MATCQFALEDFPRAHSNLEEALSLSGHNTETVSDYRQLAEILNNLGCLSYMGGKPDKAKILFQESLQAQAIAADDSLYTGTQFLCHSGESELDSLNNATLSAITNHFIGIDVSHSLIYLDDSFHSFLEHVYCARKRRIHCSCYQRHSC
jgi:tetratricopeptide (TPR) repeat protein